ncbi:MAG: hypothetical protein Q9205_003111 [Flavoplaca limonia]
MALTRRRAADLVGCQEVGGEYEKHGHGREVGEAQVQIKTDVISWMDLRFSEHMPEEKEANPQDRQKCHTQCESVAKVIVDAQVPVGRRRNGFASQAQADRKEKDGKKDEAQLNDAEGRGGDELVETAGSMWSEMKGVSCHGGYVSGPGDDAEGR